MLTCSCGQDLAHLSGNDHDRAQCLRCWWNAAGPGAEHAGIHHHKDTGHPWTLTPYRSSP